MPLLILCVSDAALPLPEGAQTVEGDLTYYNPALGACGQTHGDGDAVVAVSHIICKPYFLSYDKIRQLNLCTQ
jgi:hypothetical protein